LNGDLNSEPIELLPLRVRREGVGSFGEVSSFLAAGDRNRLPKDLLPLSSDDDGV
jgi:hypothetical protein